MLGQNDAIYTSIDNELQQTIDNEGKEKIFLK